jgi:hypothetical protein
MPLSTADQLEILDLAARYSQATDHGDGEALAATFTEDGVFEGPGGLARDPRLPKRVKLATLLLAAYVASPVDLVPDFVPVIGRMDDLIVMRFALRYISRSLPEGLFQEHVQRVTALAPEDSDHPAV